MTHPKMLYTYVGIDSHKNAHTAVFINCFFEKIGELNFRNCQSHFETFFKRAQVHRPEGGTLMFGMEDCASFGLMLTKFLVGKEQSVKHVNALLVARERKNRNISEKSDSIDAECAARVLLSKFGELPEAEPDDTYWVLRSLVARRLLLVRHRSAAKNYLHSLLTHQYPNYRDYFENVDCKTSLAFLEQYPSPSTLKNTTVEELAAFLEIPSNKTVGLPKAKQILATLPDTTVQFQEVRDSVVQSAVRQVQFCIKEIDQLEDSISGFLKKFDCTLTSMAGIDTVTAAQLRSCIGDIKRFPTPAKLARYAGIAPVNYGSGKRDLQFANQRGNRELNAIFFWLAVRLSMPMGGNHYITNSFFYNYYQRKISEGKTKRQALKCVERRLVNIIWTMLTNNEEYVNPPVIEAPNEKL
ncbi:MAG: IS110 family transposase [Treponema sp.]|nr:IS110 family transposase [Treponema sp.]